MFKSLIERLMANKDKKIDYKFLDEKHWFAHDYCLFLHDVLIDTLVEVEKSGLHNIEIEFSDEDEVLLEELNDELSSGMDILEILEEGGKVVEIFDLLFRQVCMGILSDMGHFIYEALECSKKGKLTVTFALLRKPLTENLLYLEYLLYDPGGFIYEFWKGDIQHFGLGQKQKINPKEVILGLYDKYNFLKFEEPEDIWRMRYEKGSSYSFQTFFQRATHLVTQSKHYRTEPTNFNFIFSNSIDKESQWEGLYSYLPMLLMHTVQVVETLFSTFGNRAASKYDVTENRTVVGYILWQKYSSWGDYGGIDVMEQLALAVDFSLYNCEKCMKPIRGNLENYRTFYHKGILTCECCFFKNDLVKKFVNERDREVNSLES